MKRAIRLLKGARKHVYGENNVDYSALSSFFAGCRVAKEVLSNLIYSIEHPEVQS